MDSLHVYTNNQFYNLESNRYCQQDVMDSSREFFLAGIKNRLDRLLIERKIIQEDMENTTKKIDALTGQLRKLSAEQISFMSSSMIMTYEILRMSNTVTFLSSNILIYWCTALKCGTNPYLLVISNGVYRFSQIKCWINDKASLSNTVRRLLEIIFNPNYLGWYVNLVDSQLLEEIYQISVQLKNIL